MTMQPGSFPWLLAHDVRLNLRRFIGMLGGASVGTLATALIAVGVVVHLLAWPVVSWLSPQVFAAGTTPAPLVMFAICTFTWMIAQSLFGASRALYDRGDLDLLLGSPLSVSRVFAAKAAAIAASTFGSIAVLALPLANTGALADRSAWLGLYPVLVGLALMATAIALALSIAMFFLVGPRRARVYTQMLGAGIGGAFVLGVQIVAILPDALRQTVLEWLETASHARGVSALSRLALPIEALQGDIAAMAQLIGLGVVTLAGVVVLLGARFARASLAAAGAAVDGGRAAAAGAAVHFHAGVGRNLRLKEWRLLARDPSLFAQLSLQIVYTVPIAVVLLRSETLPAVLALAPTLVVVAAQVSASLAWITVSGEDAPELIASAPVAGSVVDRAKLGAVALPMLAILVLPVTGLALVSPLAALIALVFAGAAAASTALLNFWHPMPGNRRGMLRRHSQSKLIGLIEHGLAVLWAIAVVLAMLGSPVAVVAIGLVAGILAVARRKHYGSGDDRVPARSLVIVLPAR